MEDARITEPFGYLVKLFKESNLIATIEMASYKAEREKEREKLILKLQEAGDKEKT